MATLASGCLDIDKLRIKKQTLMSSQKAKNRRKKLRSVRKGYTDQEKEEEGGESYSSGAH